jgi:hypothetical protein
MPATYRPKCGAGCDGRWTRAPVASLLRLAMDDAHGHKPRTVDRAKQSLNLTATKAGFDGGWAWKLPEAAKYANTDEERQHD